MQTRRGLLRDRGKGNLGGKGKGQKGNGKGGGKGHQARVGCHISSVNTSSLPQQTGTGKQIEVVSASKPTMKILCEFLARGRQIFKDLASESDAGKTLYQAFAAAEKWASGIFAAISSWSEGDFTCVPHILPLLKELISQVPSISEQWPVDLTQELAMLQRLHWALEASHLLGVGGGDRQFQKVIELIATTWTSWTTFL